jgi:hypothetical protein
MSGVHAPVPPSSMALIVACPGSRKMRQLVPEQEDTDAAKEGTVAHWVAHQTWLGNPPKVGEKHDDIEITDEMMSGAETWCQAVGKDGVTEMPVVVTSLHPDCWGTPDFWKWDADSETLTVDEYKYGHLYVDEYECWQLLTYAQGVIDTTGIQPKHFRLGVVQPRYYGAPAVRYWFLDRAEFDKHIERIRWALASPDLTVSGPQCTYCPARLQCATFQHNVSKAMTYVGEPELSPSTPAQYGAELTLVTAALALLTARKTTLEAYVEAQVRAGQDVPGWEMKPKKSNLTWLVDAATVLAAGDAVGVDLRAPAAPITPTQAIDRKLIDTDTAAALAWRPPGAAKLSPVSTKTLRKLFNQP